LQRRNLKAPAAARILALQGIVDADQVRAHFSETHFIFRIS
jgi:hypothetical protein